MRKTNFCRGQRPLLS